MAAKDDSWTTQGRLTERLIATLSPPASGHRIRWDGILPGFGVRVTAAGAKAFVLRYRNADGRDRTLTIGDPASWPLTKAIDRAKSLRRDVDAGSDPLGEREKRREAPTVNDLADLFVVEHVSKLRPGTAVGYRLLLKNHILPRLGTMRVADLRYGDIERLHREVAKDAPYAANRALGVLSKMLALAIRWEMRPDNPCKGVEKRPEHRRERFLNAYEIARLTHAIAAHPERTSATGIMLLLLTGARCTEALSATWSQFDLANGVWTKPASVTKQARVHRIPLSPEAVALLTERKALADRENARRVREGKPPLRHVFPGGIDGQPLRNVKRTWYTIAKAADLSGLRLHDLRHTHAAILASAGLSLPIIGALLGHSQPGTTARYAHLADDPLRLATSLAGRIITGKPPT